MTSLTNRIRQHMLPLISDPTDQRYTDSFGEQLDDFGDRCRWSLAGTALREWNDTILPLLQEVIASGEKDIYKGESVADCHIIRLCYMLGFAKSHANPTIVVACDGERSKPILKRIVKIIHRVSDFAQKGFKLLPALIPDLEFKGDLTGCSARIIPLGEDRGTGSPHSLCGQHILANNTGLLATIGGTIIIDGSYYAISVAHPFSETSYVDHSVRRNLKVELFTMEWALASDDECDDIDSADDSGHCSGQSGSLQDVTQSGIVSYIAAP